MIDVTLSSTLSVNAFLYPNWIPVLEPWRSEIKLRLGKDHESSSFFQGSNTHCSVVVDSKEMLNVTATYRMLRTTPEELTTWFRLCQEKRELEEEEKKEQEEEKKEEQEEENNSETITTPIVKQKRRSIFSMRVPDRRKNNILKKEENNEKNQYHFHNECGIAADFWFSESRTSTSSNHKKKSRKRSKSSITTIKSNTCICFDEDDPHTSKLKNTSSRTLTVRLDATMDGHDVSHITHLPIHTPGIYMRYVRAAQQLDSSSSSSSSSVRLNNPTLLVWNVSIARSGASVLRLRSPVTIQNLSNVSMEVLTITDNSACTSPDLEHDMASRRAFVISVPRHTTVSVPLSYASFCSSICVRPRENQDKEDHSFSEAVMFREFDLKMMHAMPSTSGVRRDCRPFHVSTSIRREKLRSHVVLSAPIVLRNVLPIDISYSLRSTKRVSSKSFRPDEAERLAASLECTLEFECGV
jgi:hypothetical protein